MRRRDVIKSALLGFVAACTGTNPGGSNNDPDDTGSTGVDTGSGDSDRACPEHVAHGTEADGWTRIPLSDHPELEDIYNGVQLRVGGQTINVAHVGDGCFVGMGSRCTHEGCVVEYRSSRNQFVCPCHGAIYDGFGETVAGPAPRGLPVFETDFDGEAVWVKVEEQ